MTDEKACIEEDIFAKSLCMMFSVAWLRETAKRTNFIKRERKKDTARSLFLGYFFRVWSFFAKNARWYEENV
jgi:hypothetical protein